MPRNLCDIKSMCSARLYAGIVVSSICPPEGGRYTNQYCLPGLPGKFTPANS
jgi:hypothetical protein